MCASFLLMADVPLSVTWKSSVPVHLGCHCSYAVMDTVAMSILLYVLPLGYYYPSDMISYFFSSSHFHIFYYLFEVSSPFLESQTGITLNLLQVSCLLAQPLSEILEKPFPAFSSLDI